MRRVGRAVRASGYRKRPLALVRNPKKHKASIGDNECHGEARLIAYAAAAVAGLALAFTIASFWWLHAREGNLEATRPLSFAFATREDQVRLRFPLAIFNTGAKALIVSDLRVALDDEPDKAPLEWITTRRLLRPGSDDEHAFATPFAVQGRETREVIAEFGDERSWQPLPGVPQRLRLQAQVHPRDEWVDLVVFEWWPAPENASAYLTYRNQPPPARG